MRIGRHRPTAWRHELARDFLHVRKRDIHHRICASTMTDEHKSIMHASTKRAILPFIVFPSRSANVRKNGFHAAFLKIELQLNAVASDRRVLQTHLCNSNQMRL
jgi:hypothetical protein